MEIKYIKCSDIIEVMDGTHDSPKYISKKEEGYVLITSKNIKNNKIDFEDVNYISEEDYLKIINRSKVCSGDIIMPMIGTIGNPVIIGKNTEFAIKNVALFKIGENEEINSNYFYYLLKSDIITRQLDRNKRGGTQSFVSLKNLRELRIPQINIEEQNKIVEVLDKAQELIDKRKEQIEVLDELVKSKFIEMFGSPYKNEKGWEIAEIGRYLNILTDYHSNGSYETLRDNVTLLDTPSYALMVRTTDLENNNFENEVKYIDEHAYNHLEKSKVFGGEIIINKIGSAGKVYLMPYLNRPVSLAMNQFLLRFDEEKVNHIFLYNLLLTPYMESKIKEKVRGAVTKTITKDAIREINIIVPPISLQREFVKFVKQVDKLKFKMEDSLKELEDNFNSLMQKAFKGKLFKEY